MYSFIRYRNHGAEGSHVLLINVLNPFLVQYRVC